MILHYGKSFMNSGNLYKWVEHLKNGRTSVTEVLCGKVAQAIRQTALRLYQVNKLVLRWYMCNNIFGDYVEN